jgi:hypothetical protein
MDRKEFLRSGCGLCGCAALVLITPAKAAAAEEKQTAEQLQERLNAMSPRVAWLIEEMDSALDEPTRTRILKAVGRRCARQSVGELIEKYRGNLDGLIAELEKSWGGSFKYDRDQGTLRWASRESATCPCPLVGTAAVKPALCNCSAGFVEELYGAVSGRKAEARIEGSILRGDGRCTFSVRLA